MIPQEFKDKIHLLLFQSGLRSLGLDYVQIEFEKYLKEYAKLMCQKQKEICADFAEPIEEGFYNRNDDPDYRWVVNEDSILNSPFPKELNDAED